MSPSQPNLVLSKASLLRLSASVMNIRTACSCPVTENGIYLRFMQAGMFASTHWSTSICRLRLKSFTFNGITSKKLLLCQQERIEQRFQGFISCTDGQNDMISFEKHLFSVHVHNETPN